MGITCRLSSAEKDLIGCQPKTPRCTKIPEPLSDTILEIQEIDGEVLDVQFAGKPEEVIFALAGSPYGRGGGSLWRNDKKGEKFGWLKMDSLLQEAADEANLTLAETVSVTQIVRNPANIHHILFRGEERVNWITKDLGGSYVAVRNPGNVLGTHIFWIKPHATEPEWLLALVRGTNCFQSSEDDWGKCANDLFYSNDFGYSWTNLTANAAGRVASFITAEWGWRLGDIASQEMSKETILATAFEDVTDFRLHESGWDAKASFIISSDMFQSQHETIVPCGNQFQIAQDKIFLARTSVCDTNDEEQNGKGQAARSGISTVQLHVSSDYGKTFQGACFPVPLEDNGYFLLEMERQTFLLIDHDDEDLSKAVSPTDNLYNSDSDSTVFTLSLPNVYTTRYSTDFHHVGGIDGVYIVNQMDKAAFNDPDIMEKKAKWEDFLITKLSRDGGSEWHPLPTPSLGADSKPYTCSNCSLHLHGISSWTYTDGLSPLYSHRSAPGIIMGVGNVGQHLIYEKDLVNTYISVDAGLNWDEICKGSHIYEFGDHGGVIVMARHATDGPTDHLWFSMDEGECWQGPVRFAYTIDLQNIRVEPRGASHLFILHGTTCLASSAAGCTARSSVDTQGVIIAFDVEKILPSLPTCTEADFLTWSPTERECILGENITMVRRKRSAQCFNGLDFERGIEIKQCDCSDKDTECDYGSYFDSSDGGCKHLPDFDFLRDSCPAIKDGEYKLSETDERFISNDHCLHKTKVIPGAKEDEGDESEKKKHGSGWKWLKHFIGFIFLSILVVVLVGILWMVLPTGIKDNCLGILPHSISEIIGGVLDTLGALFSELWYQAKNLVSRGRGSVEGGFEPLSGGDEFLVDYDDIQSARPLR